MLSFRWDERVQNKRSTSITKIQQLTTQKGLKSLIIRPSG